MRGLGMVPMPKSAMDIWNLLTSPDDFRLKEDNMFGDFIWVPKKPEPIAPIDEIVDGCQVTGNAYPGDLWEGIVSDEYGNYIAPFSFTGDRQGFLLHVQGIIDGFYNDPYAGD